MATKAVQEPRLEIREVPTRCITTPVQCMLWGRAAGRCEFEGCNRPLWKSLVTQQQLNVAQKAHIYSFSRLGPRGRKGIDEALLNDISNLMLVCHVCHRQIDEHRDGGKYSAALLRGWKSAHERRVEIATGITPEKQSHLVLYGANVGSQSMCLSYKAAASALFPRRYPASDTPIILSTVNSSIEDRDPVYWSVEETNLRRKFQNMIGERIASGDINHASLFAIAPQPLLVLLGTLLGDILPCDVYQLHREPSGWSWPEQEDVESVEFLFSRPQNPSGIPCLVIATSATLTDDRIIRAVGDDATIWTISVPTPHNDVVKKREQLRGFRRIARLALDEIKAVHGQDTLLHVFPATAVSLAIEFGRVRMPKADMPLQVYDHINSRGGFIPALTFSKGKDE